MLPTFVIGLREGLEAALIVGIIAAFLRKQGRRDLVRWVMGGVAVAVVLCVGAGVALDVYSHNLPQRQQEGLETVIGFVAVGMVTYMVVWMRRNSRNLKGQLEGLAADAMTTRSGAGRGGAARAMVLMAFLAVIREGLETVVFLLAAFNENSSSRFAGLGLVLGLALAVALGYGIYRGGVHINLSRFFRATGLVLVLVAAGIVVNALHTAHEAGWLNAGQGGTVDLSWLVAPGTVQASLLTGMLGIQTRPVVVEIVGWLAYLVPVGLYVAWPPGRPAPARLAARSGAAVAACAAVGALVLGLVAPSAPDARPVTRGGGLSAQVVSRTGDALVLRTRAQNPVAGTAGALAPVRLSSQGAARHDGVTAERYTTAFTATGSTGPSTLPLMRIAALNGGHLPLGAAAGGASVPVTYHDAGTLSVWLDLRTDRVLDLAWHEQLDVQVNGQVLARPVGDATVALPAASVQAALADARADHARLSHRDVLRTVAGWLLALAVLAVLVALGFSAVVLRERHRGRAAAVTAEPVRALIDR